MKSCLLLFAVALVLVGGCAAGSAPQRIVAMITKPILGFAAEDAKTTLDWIDQQVKDGKLSMSDAQVARQCPESVLALAAYRDQAEAQKDVAGKKGLIYSGTLLRYGGMAEHRQIRAKFKDLMATCSELVPTEKLLTFGIAP